MLDENSWGQTYSAATGATSYNVLQNNGATAHQAVFHVHFHIIPKFSDAGLGIGWKTKSLQDDDAQKLISAMHDHLASEV